MTNKNDSVETVSVKAPKAQYPFRSKASILAQIKNDPYFAVECLQIMNARQTAFEQESLKTLVKNRSGWMSSHAVNGGKLAKKAREEGLTSSELDQAVAIVSRYTKQLAAHFRQEEIARDPSLAELATIFSAA